MGKKGGKGVTLLKTEQKLRRLSRNGLTRDKAQGGKKTGLINDVCKKRTCKKRFKSPLASAREKKMKKRRKKKFCEPNRLWKEKSNVRGKE